jgi:hypothetical protein
MLGLSTECYVKRAHPQCVDAVAIRKIASTENSHLETDVRSAGSGMDATDRHEVLRGPTAGSFSKPLSIHTYSYGILTGWCPYSPQVLHFASHGNAAPVVETH